MLGSVGTNSQDGEGGSGGGGGRGQGWGQEGGLASPGKPVRRKHGGVNAYLG